MPRNNYDCCFFMCVIIEIVLIGVTINYSLKYNDSLKYNQLKCNITRIEYPDKIPTTTEEYNNNFVKCDCGKKFKSNSGLWKHKKKCYWKNPVLKSDISSISKNDFQNFHR